MARSAAVPARTRGRRPPRRWVPLVVGVSALVALVVGVQPGALGRALHRLDPAWYPVLAALALGYYVLQGLRWHLLLRAAGIDITPGRTLLLTVAGQSTSLLPLGELGRAVFVAEVAQAPVGVVAGTVTVQELTYSSLLLAVAVLGTLGQPAAVAAVVLALLGTVAAFVILLRPGLFDRVLGAVDRVPPLRGLEPSIRELRDTVAGLLRIRAVYTSAWLAALQVGAAVTLLWASVDGIRPGSITWPQAALVYTVINVGSAISLVPGGLGAFELGGAGLLAAAGVPFDIAAAALLVHRGADKGLGTLAGFICYFVARRRYGMGARLRLRTSADVPPDRVCMDPA